MAVWKPVPGYEGIYEASDQGAVRTLPRIAWDGHYIDSITLKPFTCGKNGRYLRVKLYIGKKKRTVMLHRVIATTFIPNPLNKPQVNHIDGNRMNNAASNLEWCTASENVSHAVRTGLLSVEPMVEATRKRVKQYSKDGTYITTWNSMTEAANAVGRNVSGISFCCSGRIHTCGGYKWSLEN